MVPFVERSGYDYLANKPVYATVMLEELGEESFATGKLIVYTSGDSVFQIAANEVRIPVDGRAALARHKLPAALL